MGRGARYLQGAHLQSLGNRHPEAPMMKKLLLALLSFCAFVGILLVLYFARYHSYAHRAP